MYISESGSHLYRFYKQKEEIFHKNFLIILRKPGINSFHDFRVSIKRIKAIFRLLELISPDFNAIKNLKPFRAVYNTSGKIREIQVNLKTIENYQLKPESRVYFQDYCSIQEKKNLSRLHDKLIEFDHKSVKKAKKKIKKCCEEITQEEILKKAELFIRDRFGIIEGNISVSPNEVSTHEARICLKEISAVLMLLRKMQYPGFDKKLLEFAKVTEDKLGRWHDKVDLVSFIEKFIRATKLSAEIKEEYRAIQLEILKENKEFLGHIESLMKATIAKIKKRIMAA